MNPNDPKKALDKLLVEQSSEFLERMPHGSENERKHLVEWLLQSKRHVRTHLFMTALEEELRHIDPERRMPIPQVRVGQTATVVSLKSPSSADAVNSMRRQRMWAAAAAVFIAAVAGISTVTFQRAAGWQEFKTAIGEQRAVQLEDGSIVQLNTGSRVRARLSETAREVRLLQGEALFRVQQQPGRPFSVSTSDATIVAVGTQFNVYRLDGRTRVSVLEGRVRVSAVEESPSVSTASSPTAPLLAAGEEAEVRQDGRIDRVEAPNAIDTAAWVQRRVVFKQERLEDLVLEFNRYRKSPHFQVEDAALAARRYSGTFDIDDPSSLEEVLANERDITVARRGEAIVIRRRSAAIVE